MSKFVRVKLENGALATVTEALAKNAGLEPLDPEQHPAVDGRGKPLAEEYPEPEPEAPASVPAPIVPASREQRPQGGSKDESDSSKTTNPAGS
jgi:hypothetical protein